MHVGPCIRILPLPYAQAGVQKNIFPINSTTGDHKVVDRKCLVSVQFSMACWHCLLDTVLPASKKYDKYDML